MSRTSAESVRDMLRSEKEGGDGGSNGRSVSMGSSMGKRSSVSGPSSGTDGEGWVEGMEIENGSGSGAGGGRVRDLGGVEMEGVVGSPETTSGGGTV